VLPGKVFTPKDVIAIVARRKWLLLLPFSVGLAAAPFIAQRIPELYRSETLIMVIPQQVPNSYVTPTVTGSIQDRLTSINDVILSRSRLERTINELDLYKDERATGIMEDVVTHMRSDITVTFEARQRQSFRVSYVSKDPALAQKVTTRLASLYIDENLRDRENLAEGTSLFLESQLEEAKKRLIEHEEKLEAYRRRFSGELPSQVNSNFQAIAGAQMRLGANAEAINRARERRVTIERQIGDLQLGAEAASMPTALPAAQQVAAAEQQLEQLKLKYTSDHPDIRSTERLIRELRARLEEELRNPPPPDTTLSPTELARQKRLTELREDMAFIDQQIKSREEEEARLNASIQDYQQKVAAVPARESELVELTRDYGTLQASYAGLLAKRQESQLAENLERRQIGEQFRVLDPASLPQRPFNFNARLAWTASGAIAGFMLGLLIAAFLELQDSSFKSEDDVMRALSLPVLALVPVIASDREKRARRWRTLALNVAGTMVVLASVGVLIAWRLQP